MDSAARLAISQGAARYLAAYPGAEKRLVKAVAPVAGGGVVPCPGEDGAVSVRALKTGGAYSACVAGGEPPDLRCLSHRRGGGSPGRADVAAERRVISPEPPLSSAGGAWRSVARIPPAGVAAALPRRSP